ncbi:MAG: M24 family metallopeptidase, partial [bacterium]
MTAQAEQGISHDEIFLRLERVKAAAVECGVAGLVTIARPFYERPANVAYLSNHFPPFPTGMFWGEMRGMGHSALVIPLRGEPVLAMGVRWPQATQRHMATGEIVVTDIVGVYWGQQFDVNRTFVVGRRPTDRQRRLLDAALEATRSAIAVARPGVPAEALVAAANWVIEARGFGPHARPFIGYGIGYETMEPPLLVTGEVTPLAAGMVLCVEPGIDIPSEEGVRIEEEIIVTDGEPEVITHFHPSSGSRDARTSPASAGDTVKPDWPYLSVASGPGEVTNRTLRDHIRPVVNHYDPTFIELFARTTELLKSVFQTQHDVVIMQGETVLGME